MMEKIVTSVSPRILKHLPSISVPDTMTDLEFALLGDVADDLLTLLLSLVVDHADTGGVPAQRRQLKTQLISAGTRD